MSRQRSRGTAFETSLLPLLRDHYGRNVHRAPLRGTKDLGDFILPEDRFILEAKNQKQMKLAEWLDEAHAEAQNATQEWGWKVAGVVVHKRRGVTDPALQYVTLTLGDFLKLVAPCDFDR